MSLVKKLRDGYSKARQVFEKSEGAPLVSRVGFRRERTIQELVDEALHGKEMRLAYERSGIETIEEFNDFELPDEDSPELTSDFEMVHDDELGHEVTRREARDLAMHRAKFDQAVKDGYFNKPRVEQEGAPKSQKEKYKKQRAKEGRPIRYREEEDSSDESSDE